MNFGVRVVFDEIRKSQKNDLFVNSVIHWWRHHARKISNLIIWCIQNASKPLVYHSLHLFAFHRAGVKREPGGTWTTQLTCLAPQSTSLLFGRERLLSLLLLISNFAPPPPDKRLTLSSTLLCRRLWNSISQIIIDFTKTLDLCSLASECCLKKKRLRSNKLIFQVRELFVSKMSHGVVKTKFPNDSSQHSLLTLASLIQLN